MSITKKLSKAEAFLVGMGSAFALFPTHQLEQFSARESIASRINGNFRRTGDHLRSAMGAVRDEQEKGKEPHAG